MSRTEKKSDFSTFDVILKSRKIEKVIEVPEQAKTSKDLDFETLVEQGGVCSSWKDLYCLIGEELGWNTNTPKIDIGQEIHIEDGEEIDIRIMHTFCIWSDNNKTGYVILDQTRISPFAFGESE